MKEELRKKLLDVFQVEYQEHLEYIRSFLAKSEDGKAAFAPAQLDEAFRRAHSLKGAARAVDLKEVQTLAHRVETLFGQIREEKKKLDSSSVAAIQSVMDAIEDYVFALRNNKPLPDTNAALSSIDCVLEGKAPPPLPTAPAPQPKKEPPRDTPSPSPSPSPSPVSDAESLRIQAKDLDRLLQAANEIMRETQNQSAVESGLSDVRHEVDRIAREWESMRRSAAQTLQDMTQVEQYKPIAHFIEELGTLIQSLTRQTRSTQVAHKKGVWALESQTRLLQRGTREARTIPADVIFQGFRKMVRDLAREEGKEINFKMTGLDVRADRVVLQSMKDSVMHLLRNALGHGIEKPEERKKARKPSAATLSLLLRANGNRLEIEIDDDGRGLDLKKIQDKAVKKNLISEKEAHHASEKDLKSLIFRPGFSTAAVVTELSGRGMGLSVVSEAVTKLQGEILIPDKKDAGTRFVLSLPLTISTHRFILVKGGDQTFAVPALAVERLIRVERKTIQSMEGVPGLSFGGRFLNLQSLAHTMGMAEQTVSLSGDLVSVMVLCSGGKRLAVAVDAFQSEREAVLQDIKGPATHFPKILGGILLENGAVVLVLDLLDLLHSSRANHSFAFEEKNDLMALEKPSQILVVDDSITTRTLEKSVLEASGYQVQVAVDGVEALNKLRADEFSLVISDVEMPNMNGFELLEQVKKDQRLAGIPIIMVTSLERKEDQERGLTLGAEAYIVKRKFDQSEILETIQQFI